MPWRVMISRSLTRSGLAARARLTNGPRLIRSQLRAASTRGRVMPGTSDLIAFHRLTSPQPGSNIRHQPSVRPRRNRDHIRLATSRRSRTAYRDDRSPARPPARFGRLCGPSRQLANPNNASSLKGPFRPSRGTICHPGLRPTNRTPRMACQAFFSSGPRFLGALRCAPPPPIYDFKQFPRRVQRGCNAGATLPVAPISLLTSTG